MVGCVSQKYAGIGFELSGVLSAWSGGPRPRAHNGSALVQIAARQARGPTI